LSQISIAGASTGSATFTLESPATSTNRTITLADATGTMVVSGTTPSLNGITFPATQVASAGANTLDDYEEGTWTPTLINNGTVTYVAQFGRYTKIGNVVTIWFYVECSNYSGGSGGLAIGALPFTTGIEGNFGFSGVASRLTGVNLTAAFTWASFIADSTGGTRVSMYESGDNVSSQQVVYNQLAASGSLSGTVTYKT
jgi:hypothetical protein